MPEIRFQIQWPDGTQDLCYSPSLVVKEYFTPNTGYALDEFVTRSRTALQIASDRVQAKYGFPCGRAMSQMAHIEAIAARYGQHPHPVVQVLQFIE